MSKALNFHIEIDCKETLHGNIFANGTATGNINRIHVDGRDDLVLGSYYLRAIRANFFGFTQFYRLDYTKVIGSLDPLFTPLEILSKPFELLLWLLLVFICTVSVICIQIIRKIKFGNFFRDIPSIQHINLFILILGGSQAKLPRQDFNRILLAFFAIFCIIMRTTYQGKLFSFMQMEHRQKGPTTSDEMINEKFTFYMTQSFTEFTSELRVRERFVSLLILSIIVQFY